jgi:cystathionine beta-lyase
LATPSFVRRAVAAHAQQSTLGHFSRERVDAVQEIAKQWLSRRHGVAAGAQVTIMASPLQAIAAALLRTTEPGDRVAVVTPAYPPLLHLVESLGRRLVETRLGGGRTVVEALVAAQSEPLQAFLLTNPSNPMGSVLSRGVIGALLDAAERGGTHVVTDEVFADLVFEPGTFVSVLDAAFPTTIRRHAVFSPNKTFNLSGCGTGVLAAAGADDDRSDSWPRQVGVPPARLNIEAIAGAWNQGDGWVDEAVACLSEARAAALAPLRCAGIDVAEPHAGLFLWIDTGRGRDDPETELLARHAIAVRGGRRFGRGFERHVRVTFASAPDMAQQIGARMATALRVG